MALETTVWDAADHLTDDAVAIAYLEAVFEDGDPAVAAALNDVARARGVAEVSIRQDTGLDAVIRTLRTMGFELTAKAA